MATFARDASSWLRLDYRLLLDGGVCLYHSVDILSEDLSWLRSERYRIYEFDCRTWRTIADFHVDAASILEFPSYYGRTLDAFADCIGEIEVDDAGGTALVLRGADSVRLGDGRFLYAVLDVLVGATRSNLLFGRRFLTLLQVDNPAAQFEPVGAVPIPWSPREWLNAERGL